MLSLPIMLESLVSPLLLAMFAIHALYTEFVGRCTVSSTMTRRFVAVDWITMSGLRDVFTMSGNCSFLPRSACLLENAMLLCVAGWHIRCAFFDKRDEGDASVFHYCAKLFDLIA